MSMSEAIGRIQGIQSMIAQLSQPVPPAAGSAPDSSAGTTGSAAFSQALAAASASGGSGLSAALSQLPRSAGTTTAAAAPLAMPGTAGAAAPAGQSATAVNGAATGTDVVTMAKKYIGVPYVWGGTDPASGMDCSGFVQRVFRDLNIELPRVVSDQMQQGTPVASLAEAKPGDLLVSFGGNHISIYLGDGKAIDAPVPGQTIQVRDAWEKHSNLTSIRRIVPPGAGQ